MELLYKVSNLIRSSGDSEGKESPETRETQVQSLGREDSLDKGNSYPLQYLAWRIPWTEIHGGIQSMELQSVGHD